jgi:hypothetical protein
VRARRRMGEKGIGEIEIRIVGTGLGGVEIK